MTATFEITEGGLVDNINLTGCGRFFRETQNALRHWRFAPGQPLQGQSTAFRFTLNGSERRGNQPFGEDGCRVLEQA